MYSFIFNPRSLYWGLDLFALSCLSPLTFSTGFIDKNNDLLYRHIKEVSTERIQSGSAHYKAYILEELTCVCVGQVMRQSKNSIMQQCFSSDEVDSRRRPETVRH